MVKCDQTHLSTLNGKKYGGFMAILELLLVMKIERDRIIIRIICNVIAFEFQFIRLKSVRFLSY